MANLISSNVGMFYIPENVFGQTPKQTLSIISGDEFSWVGNNPSVFTLYGGVIKTLNFDTLPLGFEIIVSLSGKDYTYTKTTETTITHDGIGILPNIPSTAGQTITIILPPPMTEICVKGGGIQVSPEKIELACMSEDQQVNNAVVNSYTSTITIEKNYTASRFDELAIASAIHGDIIDSVRPAATAITSLGSNKFSVTTSQPLDKKYIGSSFRVYGTPTGVRLYDEGIFYISNIIGWTVYFTSGRQITSKTVNHTIEIFRSVVNSTIVHSITFGQAYPGIGYWKSLTGGVIHSMDLSAPGNELISTNYGLLMGGEMRISPSTTNVNEAGTPPYSKLIPDTTSKVPFIGSKSFLYLNGQLYPVSDLTVKTGETFGVERGGRSDETKTSLYPNKVTAYSLSQISGTFKTFLDQKSIRLIAASRNNCTAEIFMVLQSAPVCLDDGTQKTHVMTIHIPSANLVVNDDNPAINTPTAVNVEFGAGRSSIGYTIKFGFSETIN